MKPNFQPIVHLEHTDTGDTLVFDTGGGLQFWMHPSQGLDIQRLEFKGRNVGWLPPEDFQNDPGYSPALTGFLVTCGFENVRQRRVGLPLHGSLPLSAAELNDFGVAETSQGSVVFAQGVIHHRQPSGAILMFSRQIAAPVGGAEVHIHDRVTNLGSETEELFVLYHTNFGRPVTEGGASALVQDQVLMHHQVAPNGSVEDAPPALCKDLSAHSSWVATLQTEAIGAQNRLVAKVEAPGKSLPFFQVWSDPRPERDIFSIEPVNCDRNPDGTSGPGFQLASGKTWETHLKYSFAFEGA